MSLNFNTSLSGLFASQRHIQVAQNNIANAETEGYARQRLNVEASDGAMGSGVGLEIGSGVIAKEVVRIRDIMLVEQGRNEGTEVGYYGQIQNVLQDVEIIFGEGQEGSISDIMSKFFNSWEELNKFPEENSYRLSLLGQAERFVNKVNTVSEQIRDVKGRLDEAFSLNVEKINSLSAKIANVNSKISMQATERPNALLDERDRYIDELSKLIDIKVTDDIKNPGLVNVQAGSVFIVSSERSNPIKEMEDSATQERFLVANGVILTPKSGEIKAQLELKNKNIPEYEAKLDELVNVLVTEINSHHSTGFGLDNSTGNAFFTGTTAGTISLNSVLKNNPEKIALSSAMNTPGNSDIGKLIAGVRDQNLYSSGTVTPSNFYNGFIVDLATDLNVATDSQLVHENVFIGIQTAKQSIQGVNIDEEMTNLMQAQHSYNANAKAIKAIDETLTQLFSIVQ